MNLSEINPYIRYVNNYSPNYSYVENERIIFDNEFMYIMSGSAILYYGEKKYFLKKGDLFYLKPFIKNHIVVDGKDNFRTHCIHFDWNTIDEKYNFTAEEFYMHSVLSNNHKEKTILLKSRPYIEPDNFHLAPYNDTLLYEIFAPLFEKCYRKFIEHSPSSMLLAKAVFLEIIAELFRILSNQDSSLVTHPKISAAIEFIRQNYDKPINEISLAKKYNLSPRYFGKLFRSSTGQSISSFILDTRLFAAKEMLIGSDMTIEEIALKIGFNDAFYFSRCFKMKEGISPSSYRALMR